MEVVNAYTLFHLFGWFLAGRFTRIIPSLFIAVSLGWELLEMFLDYPFAIETLSNKGGDVTANFIGYFSGRYFRNK